MRKIFTILTIILLFSTSLMAQKKRWGYFGLKTGLNISSLRLGDDALDAKWRSGFVLGAFVKIPASANFAIQPEFLYSSMGGDVESALPGKNNYRLNYFSIPVLGKYSFNKNWSAVFGPQVDFIVKGKTNGGEEITNDLKEVGFTAVGGFEYWVKPCIVIGARYLFGFNSIWQESTAPEWKNHGAQITIGFQLAK